MTFSLRRRTRQRTSLGWQSQSLCLLLISICCLLISSTFAADPIIQPSMSQPAAGNGNNNNNNNNNNAASSTSAVASSSIPQNAAAGGITITQPAQTAQASYYKIASGVPVTFGWNFTSILQYPSSLYVYAYCSENSNSYPIAASPSNGLPGRATQVVWDPYSYSMTAQNSNLPQLIQATYRLKIFDERGETVGATGGLFQPNSKVEFALYIPSSYTPLADGWICGSCNGAMSLAPTSPAMLALLSTLVVMLAGAWGVVARN